MNRHFILVLSFFLIISCSTKEETNNPPREYAHDVGDIVFDPNLDDSDFKLCDSTKITTSRRALLLHGSSNGVSKACFDQFKFNTDFESFSGYITIRFIVNCNNQSGRFRVASLDWDFSKIDCPEGLKAHVLDIVKGLNGWEHSQRVSNELDVAKFLNFKISNGKLQNVLQ